MKTLKQYQELPPVPMILFSTEGEAEKIGACERKQKEKMRRFVRREPKLLRDLPKRCMSCEVGALCYQLHTAMAEGDLIRIDV